MKRWIGNLETHSGIEPQDEGGGVMYQSTTIDRGNLTDQMAIQRKFSTFVAQGTQFLSSQFHG
jgi:hypothetical protein